MSNRPYVHSVGHCYRCGTEIEPWLAGLQWFVAVDPPEGSGRSRRPLEGRLTFWPERRIHAFTPVDGRAPRLEHLPPAVVGASDSRVVLPERPPHVRRGRGPHDLPPVRVG